MRVIRLRVLRRGWGRFKAEDVTLMVDPLTKGAEVRNVDDLNNVRSAIDLIDILDLDDEDAETGLPSGRMRAN